MAMLLLPFLLVLSAAAQPGQFKIAPILNTVAPGETMTSYRLHNTGDAPITIQVSAFDWRQEQGERLLEESQQLLVVPPIVTLDAGEQQLVRVALKRSSRAHELPFRLQFEEIPKQSDGKGLTVGTALRIDVPLFFSVPESRPEVDWTLARTSRGGLALAAHNAGKAHARFSSLRLENSEGESLAEVRAPMYLLPGKSRVWHFPEARTDAGSQLTLQLREGATRSSSNLVVE